MWAVATFFSSLVLIVLFIFFRVLEERRGARYFDAARRKLDERSSELYRAAVMGQIPKAWRYTFFATLRASLHRLVVFLIESLRAAERPLTRLLHKMRTSVPRAGSKDVSDFLKTITPNKKEDATPPEGGV